MDEALRSRVQQQYGIDDQLFDTVKDHYVKGRGSMQDIARVYHVPMAAVFDITGNSELKSVVIQGDLIDPQEATGHGSSYNPGEVVTQTYDLN